MNDILKQRLVGALVLIALGVALWPVVFVESERSGLSRTSQMEAMPSLDEVDIPAPSPLRGVAPAGPARYGQAMPEPADSTDTATAADASEAAGAEPVAGQEPEDGADPNAEETVAVAETNSSPRPVPESPKLDQQGIPVAWVLQIASLSSREKADELTAELLQQDYKAYHRAVQRNGEVRYRVFIGPVFEREKLAPIKQDIDKQLQVSAIIARYAP